MQPLGLTIKDNEAYLNGHKITDLAKEYKTPLYVMDETTIKNAITTYQENMKSDKYRFDLVYASKAFLTLEFVKYIDALQLHIDAVSLGDLYVIQKSGMSLNKVVFHGNNKSNEEDLVYPSTSDETVDWIRAAESEKPEDAAARRFQTSGE